MANHPFSLPVAPPPATRKTVSQLTRSFSGQLYKNFLECDIDNPLKDIKQMPDERWIKAGQTHALSLFHEGAKRVPAYKKFLKENGINPSTVKTIEDFEKVPWVNKKNYLSKYSFAELSWDGLAPSNQMISVSSGSSGNPYYWPRGSLLEMETTFVQEAYLKDVFELDKYSTLYVNAFAMGMYIAGPIILNSALRVAQKGYPLAIITPGLDLEDNIRAITDLAPNFEQIVLAGYPPFLKDIVDVGQRQKFKWSKYQVRFLLAGEGFNESWRDYVAEKVGQKNVATSFINIYGTADASIVGHETPTSIAIRKLADSKPDVFSNLFPEERNGRLPTLVQYYPTLKYFEVNDNELIFTSTAGIALIRYNIHDFGGVLSYQNALTAIGMTKQEFSRHLKQYGRSLQPWQLPFVYLYGKSDHTVTLYGLNVYPENIKSALEDEEIREDVTGRFTMSTEYHPETSDQYLLINVELQSDGSMDMKLVEVITESITKHLRHVNTEYNKLYNSIGPSRSRPVIKLTPYNDPTHFTRGIKHRWT